MYRIKTIVFLLLAIAALSSCNKRYDCVCIYNTGTSAGEVAGISKEVTGRTREQAAAKCKRMEGDAAALGGGCTLQ